MDDIAGWDFFDDDNDPYDASSYSSASNHGSGRAEEAGSQTNDGAGGTGVCPRCQIVPLRYGTPSSMDVNNFSQAALYAADNNIEVVEGAIGGLFNSRFGRAAFAERLPQGRLLRDRLLGPQHGGPQHPDRLRRGDAGAGQRLRRGGPGSEQRRDRRVPRRPGHPDLGADRHLVPQLGHHPVRRPRAHGHAGRHRVAGHRPGGGSGRAGGVVRAPEEPGRAARAERDQAAAHAHGRGRGGAEHHRTRAWPTPRRWAGTSTSATAGPTSGSRSSGSTRARSRRRRSSRVPTGSRRSTSRARRAVQISGRLSAKRAAGYTWKLQWAPGIEPAEARLPGREHAERHGADRRRARARST